MKVIGYLVLAAAALTSLAFVQVLKPATHWATLFISGWLLLPHAGLALVLFFAAKERTSVIASVVVAAVVAGAGLLFLTAIVYLRPDSQGGIAVLLTPLYQGVGIGVLLPSCRWLFGKIGR